MPSPEDIEGRLWLAAQHRAAQDYFEIAPDCAGYLKEFIRDGVARLMGEGFGDDPTHIALAEINIIAFTTRMIIEARTRNLPRLHEPTFFGARAALCPIWPFC